MLLLHVLTWQSRGACRCRAMIYTAKDVTTALYHIERCLQSQICLGLLLSSI
jgi:hypothetical protein